MVGMILPGEGGRVGTMKMKSSINTFV